MLDRKENEWNKSYKNKDNFVFYPQEDIIRFISKYIRKKTGINQFLDQNQYHYTPKVLDFGCGIGRHVILLDDFKLDGYGFDLSEHAINIAKSNFKQLGYTNLIDKVIVADITKLPYESNSFDFMLSHGVLDSMPFDIAKKGIIELHRCLNDKGKIYFDLISTDDASYDESQFEKTVDTIHEYGTIQSYFNIERINSLLSQLFEIKELKLSTQKDITANIKNSRYHVVAEKI